MKTWLKMYLIVSSDVWRATTASAAGSSPWGRWKPSPMTEASPSWCRPFWWSLPWSCQSSAAQPSCSWLALSEYVLNQELVELHSLIMKRVHFILLYSDWGAEYRNFEQIFLRPAFWTLLHLNILHRNITWHSNTANPHNTQVLLNPSTRLISDRYTFHVWLFIVGMWWDILTSHQLEHLWLVSWK